MAQGGSEARSRYVAVISYSHKAAAIGRWLHRRLETCRIPRRLAGSEGEHARLTPTFRDRGESPAAGDHSEKVRAALAISDNLIVVCSTNAADMLKEGDGRRLGVLKLAAGLSGVGPDALVQRDAQRNLPRVTAVTLAAVAAMLAMAVLTILALSARAEAERQRAEGKAWWSSCSPI